MKDQGQRVAQLWHKVEGNLPLTERTDGELALVLGMTLVNLLACGFDMERRDFDYLDAMSVELQRRANIPEGATLQEIVASLKKAADTHEFWQAMRAEGDQHFARKE